jgi:hypothetical protein
MIWHRSRLAAAAAAGWIVSCSVRRAFGRFLLLRQLRGLLRASYFGCCGGRCSKRLFCSRRRWHGLGSRRGRPCYSWRSGLGRRRLCQRPSVPVEVEHGCKHQHYYAYYEERPVLHALEQRVIRCNVQINLERKEHYKQNVDPLLRDAYRALCSLFGVQLGVSLCVLGQLDNLLRKAKRQGHQQYHDQIEEYWVDYEPVKQRFVPVRVNVESPVRGHNDLCKAGDA